MHGFPFEWEPCRGETTGLVPGLTYSWLLHGFPHKWEPCCFPSSSSRGKTTCPSPSLQLTFAWLHSSMGALLQLTIDICMASLFFCTYHKVESVLNAEHLFVLKIFLLLSWVEGRQWIPSSNQTRDSKRTERCGKWLESPQVWDFSSLHYSSLLYHNASMDRWLWDWNKKLKILLFGEILFLRMLSVHRKKLFCVL